MLKKEQLGDKVIQIKDGNKSTGMTDLILRGACILTVSSVRDKKFREKTKNYKDSVICYLPKFSKEEVMLVAKLRGITEKEILHRYREVGGCPRLLFRDTERYEEILDEQKTAVDNLKEATVPANKLSTSNGDPATRHLVHIGVCPGGRVADNDLLSEYSWEVRSFASENVMDLIEGKENKTLTNLGRALTTIDHRGQPYAFERTVNWFVADGLDFIGRNGKIVEIKATHPIRVYQEDVKKKGIF